jgi:hypothetical protein
MGRTEIFRHSLRITLLLAGFLSIGTGVRVASTVYFERTLLGCSSNAAFQ